MHCGKRGPRVPTLRAISHPQTPIQSAIADLEPLRLRLIDNSEGQLFCQFIERHHYLGYRVPFGANLRYFVESRDGRILAALQWTSPAWKMTAGMINGSGIMRRRARFLNFLSR
ncbi:MAG: hypothetical protein DMG15_14770 [Acidobacteria bacterium]|nr:MAG: hypothetical protein DMG15_14770 [Acidobacteriota bacterium]